MEEIQGMNAIHDHLNDHVALKNRIRTKKYSFPISTFDSFEICVRIALRQKLEIRFGNR